MTGRPTRFGVHAVGTRLMAACLVLVSACAAPTANRSPSSSFEGTRVTASPVLEQPAPGAPAALLSGALRIPVTDPSRTVAAGVPVAAAQPELAAVGSRPKDEVAGREALIYLTDPEGRLVSFEGQARIATTVDAEGKFRFDERLPVGRPLFLTALLPGDRRLVGFVVTRPGENTITVSLASTCVAHLLARKARESGRDLAGYAAESLLDLTARTRALMLAGRLPVPDLTIGQDLEVVHAYVVAMAEEPDLRRAWGRLLGAPLVPAVTAFRADDYVYGAAASPGWLYWVTNNQIFAVPEAGGERRLLVGDGEDTSIMEPVPPDGAEAARAKFGNMRFVSTSQGDLLVFLFLRGTVGIVPAASGTRFGQAVTAGRWTRLVGDGVQGHTGDGGDGRQARLIEVDGMVPDDRGGLYLLDPIAGVVRYLSGADGVISRVHDLAATAAASGSVWTAPATGSAGFSGLAWRRLPDGREQLFTASIQHQRLGVLTQPASGSWQDARLESFAGTGVRGFAGDGGPADGAQFDFPARIDAVPLVLDGLRQQLYVADIGNLRVRGVDLATGRIRTVVGGGVRVADGEAASLRLAFQDPDGMAVGADGSLYLPLGARGTGLRVHPAD